MGIINKLILFYNGISKYSFKGMISVGKNVKFYQKLRLTGEGYIYIGANSSFGYKIGGRYYGGSCEIQTRSKEAVIRIGNNVAANNNLFIMARKNIVIEDDVLIGESVTIMDHNAHGIDPYRRRTSFGTPREIIIKTNVWIGNNVTILPGSIVGKNSIIAVGSVINGIFPDNVIIAGNPAKIIKELGNV